METYPTKRLIVFAGLRAYEPALTALERCRPDAVMASFKYLRDDDDYWSPPTNWDWPHYRYLDSGAYTFLRRRHATRAEVANLFDDYTAYLKEHLDEWHFVFDLDVDNLRVGGVPGVELTEKHREILHSICGRKLIPVWHPIAGVPAWDELIRDFGYVAMGGGGGEMRIDDPLFADLVSRAHKKGVLVHALGTAKPSVLAKVPYDTCDVTTWLEPVLHVRYPGGIDYPPAPGTPCTEKHLKFEQQVRELGYDPNVLKYEDEDVITEKLEVAIRLLQERQLEMNRPDEPGGGAVGD